MFVGLFYLPVLPTGAFLTFCHCFFSCMADRIGLVYQWKKLPQSGAGCLFKVLSTHVAFAIITHLYMAMVFYSGWSYDFTCAVDPDDICNGHSCSAQNSRWYGCEKQQLQWIMNVQPWMSVDQKATVTFYKVVFIVVLVLGSFATIWVSKNTLLGLFVSTAHYEAQGNRKTGKAWSSITSIHLYIPKFENYSIEEFPLVACDLSKFSESHVPWMCDFENYSIYSDAQEMVKKFSLMNHEIFSTCTQYIDDREATLSSIVTKSTHNKDKKGNKAIV
jgi:hypothetical protein